MGLLITNSVDLSIGEAKTNIWCSVVFRTNELLITGKVQCDIKFYISEADADAGAAQLYPKIDGNIISTCEVQCLPTDIIKNSGQSKLSDVATYFYTKVKTKLEELYGWTIEIQ